MSIITGSGPANPAPWPDPTPAMLETAAFEAIWQKIKRWDINVPDVYHGYMGATGNHVRAILDALQGAGIRLVEAEEPGEAARRAGVGNAPPPEPKDASWAAYEARKGKERQERAEKAAGVSYADLEKGWAEANERNRREALSECAVALKEVTDVAMANEFLAGLERQYANYSEVEIKLVNPRTVTHIRADMKQSLSEVMDAPAALAVIVTRKNHTETPLYYALKCIPNLTQLTALKEHFAERLKNGDAVKLLTGD